MPALTRQQRRGGLWKSEGACVCACLSECEWLKVEENGTVFCNPTERNQVLQTAIRLLHLRLKMFSAELREAAFGPHWQPWQHWLNRQRRHYLGFTFMTFTISSLFFHTETWAQKNDYMAILNLSLTLTRSHTLSHTLSLYLFLFVQKLQIFKVHSPLIASWQASRIKGTSFQAEGGCLSCAN